MRVHQNFWLGSTGADLRALGTEHLLVGLYLITNPHCNLYGLYYLPLTTVQVETGIVKGLNGILRAVSDTGFARYADNWAWVPNMLRYQMGGFSPADNRLKSVSRWYANLPSTCPFLASFWDEYSGALPLGDRRESAGTGDHAGNPTPTPRPTLEASPAPAVDLRRQLFDHWWEIYPKKHGKRAAWGEWLKLNPTPTQVEAWCDTLVRQKQSREWLKEGGQYIPDPERYLKRGKFDDEVVQRPIVNERQSGNFDALAQFARRQAGDGSTERRPPAGIHSGHGEAGSGVRQVPRPATDRPLLGLPSGHPRDDPEQSD